METHSLPAVTPFGPIRAPVGNVIHAEPRFVRPIPNNHLRMVEESPPDLCQLLREREEPRGADGWWIAFGPISALFWMAAFWLGGAFS